MPVSGLRNIRTFAAPTIFALAGLWTAGFGVSEAITIQDFWTRGVRVQAQVESVVERKSSSKKKKTLYWDSTISYVADGITRQIAVRERLDGSRIDVVYLPERPDHARTVEGGLRWSKWAAPVGLGLVFLCIGGVLTATALRKGRAS